MSNVKVQKIIVAIGDTEVALTLDEARQLQQALGDALGNKVERVREVVVDRPYYPDPYHARPYWISTTTSGTLDSVKITLDAPHPHVSVPSCWRADDSDWAQGGIITTAATGTLFVDGSRG